MNDQSVLSHTLPALLSMSKEYKLNNKTVFADSSLTLVRNTMD